MRGWVGSALVSFALPLALLGLPSTDVDAPATPATVTEFPLPHPESRPYTIVAGPDGNLWFTESWRGAIGRITPTGTITEFELDDPDSQPYGITLGADGNLWFTERIANKIGGSHCRMITEYEIPTPNAQPLGHHGHAGRHLLVHGGERRPGRDDRPERRSHRVPERDRPVPTHITTGPDGNVWFTEEIGNNIVRLDPDDPENQTEFPIETVQALPWDIAPGPDGNLWFTELAGRNIGKITPQGTITEYPVPGDFGGIAGIAAAPPGNRLWFTENDTSNVGVIDVNGQVGETFDTTDYPFGITAGPDGEHVVLHRVRECDRPGESLGLRPRLRHRHHHRRLRPTSRRHLRLRHLRLRHLRLRHLHRHPHLRRRRHHHRLDAVSHASSACALQPQDSGSAGPTAPSAECGVCAPGDHCAAESSRRTRGLAQSGAKVSGSTCSSAGGRPPPSEGLRVVPT